MNPDPGRGRAASPVRRLAMCGGDAIARASRVMPGYSAYPEGRGGIAANAPISNPRKSELSTFAPQLNKTAQMQAMYRSKAAIALCCGPRGRHWADEGDQTNT